MGLKIAPFFYMKQIYNNGISVYKKRHFWIRWEKQGSYESDTTKKGPISENQNKSSEKKSNDYVNRHQNKGKKPQQKMPYLIES